MPHDMSNKRSDEDLDNKRPEHEQKKRLIGIVEKLTDRLKGEMGKSSLKKR
jgi:hypothetical protein